MSVLKIKRVAVMPAVAEANTTYLIAVAGGNDLQVAVTNGDGTVVKKSLLRTDIAGMINGAIALSETGSSADLVAAEAAAKAYTDAREVVIRGSLDSAIVAEGVARDAGDAATLVAAKAYADQAELDAIAAAGVAASAALATRSDATLADAKAYTDTKVGTEAIDRAAGDAAALASSKTYTDNAITAEVTRSNAYANNAVATGIAALDLSATVQYAADIATRDTLAAGLTKSSLIFVVDATSDATVTVGSALYFYDTVGEAFTKVSEYESLDLIIPNKSILESFSVDQGRLAYNGALVSTVDFDAAGSTW